MKTAQQPSRPSIWQKKPWWCQPWSIILTGIILPTSVWLVTPLWWLTLPVVVGILVWWWLFLYVVPKHYLEQYHSPSSHDTQTGSKGN